MEGMSWKWVNVSVDYKCGSASDLTGYCHCFDTIVQHIVSTAFKTLANAWQVHLHLKYLQFPIHANEYALWHRMAHAIYPYVKPIPTTHDTQHSNTDLL